MPEREAAAVDSAQDAGRKFACWNIIERKNTEKPLWSRVGTAFTNKDGSINVYLDSLPMHGKVQLRDDKEGRDMTTPPWTRQPRPQVTRIESDRE